MKIDDINYSIQLKTVTISCGYDKYNSGQKESNFVSASFDFPDGLTEEDLSTVVIALSKQITQTTYLTALGRGAITKEEYKNLASNSNTRHEEIGKVIKEKKEKKEKNGTDS